MSLADPESQTRFPPYHQAKNAASTPSAIRETKEQDAHHDTEVEVGYSRNRQEPLTIEFRGRKTELTLSTYRLFTYIHELNRAEGRTEFEFMEIAEAMSGDDCGLSKTAIETLVRRLNLSLEKLLSPIRLKYNREVLYIVKRQV